jgi:hypothetical protein
VSARRIFEVSDARHERPPFSVVRVGLFETSSDVNDCAGRVKAMIDALDADVINFFVGVYGPDMFAATITLAQKAQFDADRQMFWDWRAFKKTFDDWKASWDDQTISILSADAFRQCGNYDLEAKDWYDRFVKRGVHTTAPKTTTPSAIPGVIPPTPPSGGGFPWTLAITAAALVAAGFVAWKVL